MLNKALVSNCWKSHYDIYSLRKYYLTWLKINYKYVISDQASF